MKELFRTEFSELIEQMRDEVLAEKVLDTWVRCIELGGWTSIDDIRAMPFTLLTDTDGVNLLEHTITVTKGALGLADAMISTYEELPFPIDRDRVIAGGLLHDVGKLMENERSEDGIYRKSYAGKCARHPISGAIVASEIGLPREVQNIIICHAKEGEGRPQCIEAVFVHQADFATFNPAKMKQNGLLIT